MCVCACVCVCVCVGVWVCVCVCALCPPRMGLFSVSFLILWVVSVVCDCNVLCVCVCAAASAHTAFVVVVWVSGIADARARSHAPQLWHWVKHGATLDDGRVVTAAYATALLHEQSARIAAESAPQHRASVAAATQLFGRMMVAERFDPFMSVAAYSLL